MIAQKAIGQRFVFTQQAQQQVLRFYIRRTKLAGLVSCKEDNAPCFLCIPLEHKPLTRCFQSPLPETSLSLPGCEPANLSREEALLSDWRLRHRGSKCRRTNLPSAKTVADLKLETSLPESLIQRCRRHFLGQPVMQPQYTITTPCKLKVMGDDEGSEPVLVMQSLYQVKHHFCGPVVQIAGWFVSH